MFAGLTGLLRDVLSPLLYGGGRKKWKKFFVLSKSLYICKI